MTTGEVWNAVQKEAANMVLQAKVGLRCTKCKGTDVHIAKWVNPNTGEQFDDFGSFDEFDTKWCVTCKEHELLEEFTVKEMITEEYLREMKEHNVPLEDHPQVGWCGHHPGNDGACRSPQYRTYSGETCVHGHQGSTLEVLVCETGDCRSTDDVTYEPDPYAQDINGDETPVYQCVGCREHSAADI